MYRPGLDVSTGLCGLHYVRGFYVNRMARTVRSDRFGNPDPGHNTEFGVRGTWTSDVRVLHGKKRKGQMKWWKRSCR